MSKRPSIPAEIAREVLIESGHRCAVCGAGCPLERAHIIPWHKSREHRAKDLICLCANCHQRADLERWGEKALREYKQRPWVMRQYDKAYNIPEPRARVHIEIDMELERFDDMFQRLLQSGLAGFLEIPPNSVRITSIGKGSVKVTIELPTQNAERLLDSYERNKPELARYLDPLILLDLHPEATKRERILEEKSQRVMRTVFISSTYKDLVEHRQMVIKAIRRLGMHAICMEDFGSRPEEPTAVCAEEVNKCHAFVGIYAHRYGFAPPGSERSITEQEYDLAQKWDKPCFCYLVHPDWPWLPRFFEDEPGKSKLATFKQKVSSKVVRSEFTTPDNLAWQVGADLARWLAETATPDERRLLVPITLADLAEINKLLRQLKELHHRLQDITLALDAFQSYVQLARRAAPPAEIEDLGDFWQQQCSPKLGNLGILKEKVKDDIRRVIDDVIQWQRNMEEALKDEYSTIAGIYDLVRTFGGKCTQHLLWADSELREAASRSCELSDRLMILMVEVKNGKEQNRSFT